MDASTLVFHSLSISRILFICQCRSEETHNVFASSLVFHGCSIVHYDIVRSHVKQEQHMFRLSIRNVLCREGNKNQDQGFRKHIKQSYTAVPFHRCSISWEADGGHTIQYYITLYHTILYYTVLYYTILVLYYTILYYYIPLREADGCLGLRLLRLRRLRGRVAEPFAA